MVEVGFGDEYILHQVLQLSTFDYVICLKSFHYLLLMINRDGVSWVRWMGSMGWMGWYGMGGIMSCWYDVMLRDLCVMLRDAA